MGSSSLSVRLPSARRHHRHPRAPRRRGRTTSARRRSLGFPPIGSTWAEPVRHERLYPQAFDVPIFAIFLILFIVLLRLPLRSATALYVSAPPTDAARFFGVHGSGRAKLLMFVLSAASFRPSRASAAPCTFEVRRGDNASGMGTCGDATGLLREVLPHLHQRAAFSAAWWLASADQCSRQRPPTRRPTAQHHPGGRRPAPRPPSFAHPARLIGWASERRAAGSSATSPESSIGTTSTSPLPVDMEVGAGASCLRWRDKRAAARCFHAGRPRAGRLTACGGDDDGDDGR